MDLRPDVPYVDHDSAPTRRGPSCGPGLDATLPWERVMPETNFNKKTGFGRGELRSTSRSRRAYHASQLKVSPVRSKILLGT